MTYGESGAEDLQSQKLVLCISQAVSWIRHHRLVASVGFSGRSSYKSTSLSSLLATWLPATSRRLKFAALRDWLRGSCSNDRLSQVGRSNQQHTLIHNRPSTLGMGRPVIEDENWVGVQDSRKRKQVQDRLAQRARSLSPLNASVSTQQLTPIRKATGR